MYSQPLGTQYTSPVFADMNMDGSVDLTYFDTKNQQYKIFFNMLEAKSSSYELDLCSSEPTNESLKGLKIYEDIGNIVSNYISIGPVSDRESKGLYTYNGQVPGRVRYGDFDSDGYTDLILTLEDGQGKSFT